MHLTPPTKLIWVMNSNILFRMVIQKQPLDGSETEEEVPVAEADDSDVNSEMESVLFDWH